MASHGRITGNNGSVILSANGSDQAKRLQVQDDVAGIGKSLGRPPGRGRPPPPEIDPHEPHLVRINYKSKRQITS